MTQALTGFATIWIIAGVGFLLAHIGVLELKHKAFLSNFAFLVALPAMVFTLVSTADMHQLFPPTLGVSVLAIAIAALLYVLPGVLVFRRDAPSLTIGVLCASYTNAGNLGLPVAIHLLGGGAWMAPIILLQTGLIQPAALAVLDAARDRRLGVRPNLWRYLSTPVRNPITVGILSGLVVGLLGWDLPLWLAFPIATIGDMAVPLMLIAFGVSLRRDPLPAKGPHTNELLVIAAIKIVLMPAIAALLAIAFGLGRFDVLAVTVIAALPTAQNVFIMATRYGVAEPVARDAVFWSTILCVPVILAATLLWGV